MVLLNLYRVSLGALSLSRHGERQGTFVMRHSRNLLTVCAMFLGLLGSVFSLPAAAQTIASKYNVYYKQAFTSLLHTSFGKAPYAYALVSGSLPPGATMDSTGKVSGIPTSLGVYQFSALVTDSSATPVQQTLTFQYTVLIRTDTYGGLVNLPSPAGGTGFFRMEKVGGRWNLVSPSGNTFWLSSVYVANNSFLDPAVLKNKYHGLVSNYATNRGHRLLNWGFNTLGEYTSTTGLPVTTYGSLAPSSVPMPFMMIMNTIVTAMTNPSKLGLPEAIKNISAGVPQSTFGGYEGILTDVFDPKYQQGYTAEVNYWNQIIGGFANTPWVLGITTDDADYLWAFKSSGNNPVCPYPHPVFLVATTNFQYGTAQNPAGIPYQDPTVYTKLAWANFLQQEYGTIDALNAAWGSTYTSFGDDGGFGSGTGLLDEDGRNTAWIGTDGFMLSNAAPAVQVDMDAFLYQYAYQYASVAVNTIRASDPNHLIFAPVAINNYGGETRTSILQAFMDAGMNALEVHYDSTSADMSGNNATYDYTGLPMIMWYSVNSQYDSPLRGSPSMVPRQNFSSQSVRAIHYAKDLQNFYSAQGSNGDNYVLGIDWWELSDGRSSEHTNWGLTTIEDNAYDGKEDIIASGHDKYGYKTGGETSNYGDFLTGATATNFSMYQQLIDEQGPYHPIVKKK